MLAIKNNIMSSNAARHLNSSYDGLAESVERISSGLRINSAKDDAAGLAMLSQANTMPQLALSLLR
jgi:flagellin